MPDDDKRDRERSKISLRIGEVQVELEGTSDNIKKLMDKELYVFTKKLEESTKQLPASTETAPKVAARAPEITPKPPEAASKEKVVPPPPIKPPTTAEKAAQKPGLVVAGRKAEKAGGKIGWKAIAIVLGVVCIVLSAGLVGAFAVYLPVVSDLESQIAERDTSIAALNSQVNSLTSQVTSQNAQLLLLQGEVNSTRQGIEILNSQLASYLQILHLNVSSYLFMETPLTAQPENNYTVVFQDILEYAGYVGVTVESTSNTTYVQLLYSHNEVNFDHNITVSTYGKAYFPILPGPIEIRVGNTGPPGDLLNATVTAVYYY